MANQRYILVTGAPCSGTTWVGETLATAEGFTYVHEPLNPVNQPPWVKSQSQYVLPGNIENCKMEGLLFDRINIKGKYLTWRATSGSFRDKAYYVRQALLSRLKQNRIVKEPHACLITEELYKSYNFEIVWVVRHPGAFVESMSRKKWLIEMTSWKTSHSILNGISTKSREFLMSDKLDSVQKLALAWRIIQETGHNNSKQRTQLKYEDLSSAPELIWPNIFDQLKLKKTKRTEKAINLNQKSKELNLFRIKGWKNKLDKTQVKKIFSIIEDMPRKINPYFQD